MPFFDILLLVILTVFTLNGLVKGLIRSAGSLIAAIAGIWAAIYFYPFLYDFIGKLFFGYLYFGKAVSFLIIYIVVNRLVNLGFAILNNAYDVISIIPFLKTINRLAGAIFGLVEGSLIIGFMIYFGSLYPATRELVLGWIGNSQVAPYLFSFARSFLPFLPVAIDWLKSLVEKLNPAKLRDAIR